MHTEERTLSGIEFQSLQAETMDFSIPTTRQHVRII